MPFRFFRRVRIAPGVTINLSRSGPSVSVGPRGAKVTVGHGRVRKTVGLPGTGLSYSSVSRLDPPGPRPGPRPPQARPRGTAPPVDPASAPRASGGGIAGFWARRSLAGKIAIVVVLLVLAQLILSSGGKASAPPASSAPASDLGLVAGVASGSPGGDGGFAIVPEQTATARSSPTATLGPTRKPAATKRPRASTTSASRTPTPSPSATSEAAAAATLTPKASLVTSISIKVTSLTSPVRAGTDATLTIRTAAGAGCSIDVQYASGSSTAKGLRDRTASSSGGVSWTWMVGSRTTPGTWPISIACTKGDAYKELFTKFTVQ